MCTSNQDELMNVIFGQLELLQGLAIKAGDADLAQDLSATFARCLERYCEIKRAALSDRMDAQTRGAA